MLMDTILWLYSVCFKYKKVLYQLDYKVVSCMQALFINGKWMRSDLASEATGGY